MRPASSYPGALGQKTPARKWSGALTEAAPPPAGVSLPAGPLGVTRAPRPGRALPRHCPQACTRSAHASPPRASDGCHGYRDPEVPPGGDGCPQPRAGSHGPRGVPPPRRPVRPSHCSPTMARGAGEAAAEGELVRRELRGGGEGPASRPASARARLRKRSREAGPKPWSTPGLAGPVRRWLGAGVGWLLPSPARGTPGSACVSPSAPQHGTEVTKSQAVLRRV